MRDKGNHRAVICMRLMALLFEVAADFRAAMYELVKSPIPYRKICKQVLSAVRDLANLAHHQDLSVSAQRVISHGRRRGASR